jgi:hippurate hydrolase
MIAFTLAANLLPVAVLAQNAARDLNASVAAQLPALSETYKHLHRNPELSRHEEKTSAFLAAELRKLGYTVTEHVGKYEDGSPAFGVVALLENGAGPRLLLRTDMDALPVEEKTGLEYASTVKTTNAAGQQVGVMHACGHDLHMTVLLGTAKELAARRSQWHGTLMLIDQPAEEIASGAKAMLNDHLYERFGTPDFVLSEHDTPDAPAGSVALKSGPLWASATSIDMVIRGIGGHGSAPQAGKDPIFLAAEFIVMAQGIVSRQIDPQQPAVLTVGTIHGGTKNNIIPDEVRLGLTLRTYSTALRDDILKDIDRTARGLAAAYGLPEDRMPTMAITESTPATLNDPALNERLRTAAQKALGAEQVLEAHSMMGSEDVGLYTLDGRIPGVMFRLGASDPDKLAESLKNGIPLPGPHSALFAPVYQPAIRAGVTALTAMALEILR